MGRLVYLGVESGSPEMLERIRKRTDLDSARAALKMTRRGGLLSSIYFVIGLPWETQATLAESEAFARELDPDVLEVFYAYPFPGTELHAQARELGLIEPGEVPTQAYDRPAMRCLNLTPEELVEARTRFLRRFYMRPRFILRTLMRTRSLAELGNYIRYGWRQFKEFV